MKVHYDKDEDILMLVLSNKQTDDSYDTDFGIVSIDKKGEPVLLEIFHASKFFNMTSKVLPKEIKQKFFAGA